MHRTYCVLLLTRGARRFDSLQRALAAEGLEVVGRELLDDPHAVVDVMITDLTEWPRLPPLLSRLQARGLIGLVRLGGPMAADVVLPADATPREVGLACRLLGEIVRLRRERARDRRARRHFEQLAHRDAVSGVANRRGWNRQLAARLKQPEVALPLTLVLLDIDHFKSINDRHGHPAADRVLLAIGAALVHSLRPDDLVARLGGDEFGLLVSGPTQEAAAALVQRVRGAACQAATEALGESVTLCIGFAHQATPAAHAEQLYEQADQQLRRAKAERG